MLVFGYELRTDSPMTDFRDVGADRLAGGGTSRPHAHADFPASGGRASGQQSEGRLLAEAKRNELF